MSAISSGQAQPEAACRDGFRVRKAERRQHFERYVKGWKLKTCTACSGSGRYDHNCSPRCGCCIGTGKMRVAPSTALPRTEGA